MRGSAADQAGVASGQIIVAVNGTDTKYALHDEVVDLIKASPGKATLVLQRSSAIKTFQRLLAAAVAESERAAAELDSPPGAADSQSGELPAQGAHSLQRLSTTGSGSGDVTASAFGAKNFALAGRSSASNTIKAGAAGAAVPEVAGAAEAATSGRHLGIPVTVGVRSRPASSMTDLRHRTDTMAARRARGETPNTDDEEEEEDDDADTSSIYLPSVMAAFGEEERRFRNPLFSAK